MRFLATPSECATPAASPSSRRAVLCTELASKTTPQALFTTVSSATNTTCSSVLVAAATLAAYSRACTASADAS